MTDVASTPEVTRDMIVDGLRELGLEAGDGVNVHSSLKSFGHVVGGARAVCEALMDVVTEEGTLMMPSFNHGAIMKEGGAGYFDPLETPTTNGAIPDAFWRMPGVYRSLNPTHSFAAWGRNAKRYTGHHHQVLTMGAGSPLDLLRRDGGYGLFLGVTGYRANTFHHVVEVMLGARCLGYRTERFSIKLPDGRMVEGRSWCWRNKPCPYTSRNLYADEMTERGLDRKGKIGNSEITLFRLQDCFEVATRHMVEGITDIVPCRECPIRPRWTDLTVDSDWDFERGCLKPDSPAHQY